MSVTTRDSVTPTTNGAAGEMARADATGSMSATLGSPADGATAIDAADLASPYGPERDVATGRFAPNHTASVKHGLFSARDLAGLDERIATLTAAAVADMGGEEAVPVRVRLMLETRFRLQRRLEQVDAAIEVKGITDGKGKLRAAWLQRLEGLAASIRALDAQLGLKRQAKRIGTLESHIREKYGR